MLTSYFPQHILDSIQQLAKETPDVEICGLVLEADSKCFLMPCKNLSERPEESFIISAEDIDLGSSRGDIKTVYHSHCSDEHSGFFTVQDIKYSKAISLPYLLYHSQFDCWDYFEPENTLNPFPLINRGNPKTLQYYLGWNWQWMRSDCYSILVAYFEGMLDIKVEDHDRGFDNYLDLLKSRTWDEYNESLPSKGFVKVSGLPKLHDVLVMRLFGRVDHHVAIVCDEGRILHILDDERLSEVSPLSEFEGYVRSHWRHEKLL